MSNDPIANLEHLEIKCPFTKQANEGKRTLTWLTPSAISVEFVKKRLAVFGVHDRNPVRGFSHCIRYNQRIQEDYGYDLRKMNRKSSPNSEARILFAKPRSPSRGVP